MDGRRAAQGRWGASREAAERIALPGVTARYLAAFGALLCAGLLAG